MGDTVTPLQYISLAVALAVVVAIGMGYYFGGPCRRGWFAGSALLLTVLVAVLVAMIVIGQMDAPAERKPNLGILLVILMVVAAAHLLLGFAEQRNLLPSWAHSLVMVVLFVVFFVGLGLLTAAAIEMAPNAMRTIFGYLAALTGCLIGISCAQAHLPEFSTRLRFGHGLSFIGGLLVLPTWWPFYGWVLGHGIKTPFALAIAAAVLVICVAIPAFAAQCGYKLAGGDKH